MIASLTFLTFVMIWHTHASWLAAQLAARTDVGYKTNGKAISGSLVVKKNVNCDNLFIVAFRTRYVNSA